jgi:glycosyltransferase involved in cell wall biosynthesis
VSVTALIFTLNEEVHLPDCLASLAWCDEVIVVDSFSTDRSESVCRDFDARFIQHKFEGFGSQRNWVLENIPLRNDWILILDADERVPAELADELLEIARANPEGTGAYRVRRRFYMWGRWLRYSSLYPTWVVRFIHKDRVRYVNRGHAETQSVQGFTGDLANDLIDANLKGIDEWFDRQNRYSTKEADYELALARENATLRALWGADPLQRRAALKRLSWRLPFRPVFYFFYSYVIRGGFLDGYDGFIFCMMKSVFQAMIVAKKHDRQAIRPEPGRSNRPPAVAAGGPEYGGTDRYA